MIRPRPEPFVCRLTRLAHLDLSTHENHLLAPARRFAAGGLPEAITVLQRLQHLRLGNCVTAPLTHGISLLTQLTCLDIDQHSLWPYQNDWNALDNMVVRLECGNGSMHHGIEQSKRTWGTPAQLYDLQASPDSIATHRDEAKLC